MSEEAVKAEDVDGASGEAVVQVFQYILQNSTRYGDEEDNYLANIASDLGMTRQRTHRAIRLLEEYELVRKVRKGRRKMVVPDIGHPEEDAGKSPIW